jgi:hypothetical protein
MRNCLILLTLGAVAYFLSSCGSPQSIRPDALIVVKDVQIPDSEPLLSQFATHSWVQYRPDVNSPWRRIEIVNKNSGLLHHEIDDDTAHAKKRWNERVRILSQSDGKKNPEFVQDIMAFARGYDASVYSVWPGPNSNTFAEHLMREVDGVSAALDHNAVGKEHGFYAGRTAGGTGVELQTPLLGVALGVREGVELSVFGLSGGVSFYPPAIKIPFLQRIPRK